MVAGSRDVAAGAAGESGGGGRRLCRLGVREGEFGGAQESRARVSGEGRVSGMCGNDLCTFDADACHGRKALVAARTFSCKTTRKRTVLLIDWRWRVMLARAHRCVRR